MSNRRHEPRANLISPVGRIFKCRSLSGSGCKTDVKDAEWLADLLRHGLLRGSFIPDRWQRELRELVRYRKTLVEERSRLITGVQKLLEGANIKLGDVASDLMGQSGRAILKELAAGSTDTHAMAELALSNLRGKRTAAGAGRTAMIETAPGAGRSPAQLLR